MLLENKYFKVDNLTVDGQTATLRVSLLPSCDVYRGHFPGRPVSPGACNVEMLRECFARVAGGNPRIKTIDRCRFTAVVTPAASPQLDIRLSWTDKEDGTVAMQAVVADATTQYLDFKGTLTQA